MQQMPARLERLPRHPQNAGLGCSPQAVQVLRHIRRRMMSDLGDVAPELQESRAYLRSRLQKACELLSNELYGDEVHFVLELIQNADDNAYPDGVAPELSLKVTDEGIELYNNECGFEEKHVNSICDANDSSKKEIKSQGNGYTGEKGIGFKSVFSVAQEVYIYSGGYCVMFDAKGDLGYLEPIIWDPRDFPIPITHHSGAGTTMFLRFRPDVRNSRQRMDDLRKKLGDIQPETIMFLRRLRCLVLEMGGTRRTMRCTAPDAAGHVYLEKEDLMGNGQCDLQRRCFLLVSKSGIPVPHEAADEEKRPGVTKSRVAIAFPMDPTNGQAVPAVQGGADASCLAFAYLPVCPSGLRFLVQADFILATSRETIKKELPWNTWLRTQLAVLFCDTAIKQLREHPQLQATFLTYLPLPGEVANPFFGPLASTIVTAMQKVPCIMTETGQWHTPPAALLPPTSQWLGEDHHSPLIPDHLLRALHPEGLSYVHPGLIAAGGPRVLAVLRQVLCCEQFGAAHLCACLTQPVTAQFLASQPGQWLACLYQALTQQHEMGSSKQPTGSSSDAFAQALTSGGAAGSGGSSGSSGAFGSGGSSGDMTPELWGDLKSKAAIFRVAGKEGMVTAAGGHILWPSETDPRDRQLFRHATFLADGTWQPGCEGMLTARFGIRQVSVGWLAQDLMRVQRDRQLSSFSDDELLQHVLFIYRYRETITRDLKHPAADQLFRGLFLRVQQDGPSAYAAASSLHMPLDEPSSHLTADLQQAGIRFLHSCYMDSAVDRGGSGQEAQGSRQGLGAQLLLFLQDKAGVKWLDVDGVAGCLVRLYSCAASVAPNSTVPNQAAPAGPNQALPVALDRNLVHLRYVCQHQAQLSQATLESLQHASMVLSQRLSQPASQPGLGCYRPGRELHIPLPAAAKLQLGHDLEQAGMRFVALAHYMPAWRECPELLPFMHARLGLKSASAPVVADHLLALHRAAMPSVASPVAPQALQLRQAATAAAHPSTSHPSQVQAQASNSLRNQAQSQPALTPSSPPNFTVAQQTAPPPAPVRPLTPDQLTRHLAFVLEAQHELLQLPDLTSRLHEQFLLRTDTGGAAPGGTLFLPLQAEFESLQADLRAAGMAFVHAEVLRQVQAASSTSPGTPVNGTALLSQLLGVRAAQPADVIRSIAQLFRLGMSRVCVDHNDREVLQLIRFIYSHREALSDMQLGDLVRTSVRLKGALQGEGYMGSSSGGGGYAMPSKEQIRRQLAGELEMGADGMAERRELQQGLGGQHQEGQSASAPTVPQASGPATAGTGTAGASGTATAAARGSGSAVPEVQHASSSARAGNTAAEAVAAEDVRARAACFSEPATLWLPLDPAAGGQHAQLLMRVLGMGEAVRFIHPSYLSLAPGCSADEQLETVGFLASRLQLVQLQESGTDAGSSGLVGQPQPQHLPPFALPSMHTGSSDPNASDGLSGSGAGSRANGISSSPGGPQPQYRGSNWWTEVTRGGCNQEVVLQRSGEVDTLYAARQQDAQGRQSRRDESRSFLKSLGVRELGTQEVAQRLLSMFAAEAQRQVLLAQLTDAELLSLFKFVAAQARAPGSDASLVASMRTQMPLRASIPDAELQPPATGAPTLPSSTTQPSSTGSGSTAAMQYRTAAQLYFPHEAQDWRLQDVLPASEVQYLHPEWVAALAEGDETMTQWLVSSSGMGLSTCPRPIQAAGATQQAGASAASQHQLSPDLLKAVGTRHRGRAMLCMLREKWQEAGYAALPAGCPALQQLRAMLVEVEVVGGGQQQQQQQQQQQGSTTPDPAASADRTAATAAVAAAAVDATAPAAGPATDVAGCARQPTLLPLQETYLRLPDVQQLLGDSVPYVAVPDPESTKWAFLSSLGVCTKPDAAAALKRLRQLSASNAGPLDAGAYIGLYSVILSHTLSSGAAAPGAATAATAIAAAFSRDRLIYGPGDAGCPGSHSWLPLDLKLLRWQAPEPYKVSDFWNKKLLGPHYASLPHLFKTFLKVPDASVEDLGDALECLAASVPAGASCNEDQAQRANQLYRYLAEHLAKAPTTSTVPGWLSALMQKPVLLVSSCAAVTGDTATAAWNSSGLAAAPGAGPIPNGGSNSPTGSGSILSRQLRFVCPSASSPAYLPDDPALVAMFESQPGVQLVACETSDCVRLLPLLRLCPEPVALVSQAVKQKLHHAAAPAPYPQCTSLLQHAFPFCAAILYSKQPRDFDQLLANGRMLLLGGTGPTGNPRLQVFSAQNLQVVYSLGSVVQIQRRAVATYVSPDPATTQGAEECIVMDVTCFEDMESAVNQLAGEYIGLWGLHRDHLSAVCDVVERLTEAAQGLKQCSDQYMYKRLRERNTVFPLPSDKAAKLRELLNPPPPLPQAPDNPAPVHGSTTAHPAPLAAAVAGRMSQAPAAAGPSGSGAGAAAGAAGAGATAGAGSSTASPAVVSPGTKHPADPLTDAQLPAAKRAATEDLIRPPAAAPFTSSAGPLPAPGGPSCTWDGRHPMPVAQPRIKEEPQAVVLAVGMVDQYQQGMGGAVAPGAAGASQAAAVALTAAPGPTAAVAAAAAADAYARSQAAVQAAQSMSQAGQMAAGSGGDARRAMAKTADVLSRVFESGPAAGAATGTQFAAGPSAVAGISAAAGPSNALVPVCWHPRTNGSASGQQLVTGAGMSSAPIPAPGQLMDGHGTSVVEASVHRRTTTTVIHEEEHLMRWVRTRRGAPSAATTAAPATTSVTILDIDPAQAVAQMQMEQQARAAQQAAQVQQHDTARLSGIKGELFMFQYLQQQYPGRVTERNWVSGLREACGLPALGVEPPFDFWLDDDTEGSFSGTPNALVLIEVKATASQYDDTAFEVSQEEWQLAMALATRRMTAQMQPQVRLQQGSGQAQETEGMHGLGQALVPVSGALAAAGLPAQLQGRELVYVIVRVIGTLSAQPQISSVYIDPGAKYMRGELQLRAPGGFMLSGS